MQRLLRFCPSCSIPDAKSSVLRVSCFAGSGENFAIVAAADCHDFVTMSISKNQKLMKVNRVRVRE